MTQIKIVLRCASCYAKVASSHLKSKSARPDDETLLIFTQSAIGVREEKSSARDGALPASNQITHKLHGNLINSIILSRKTTKKC